MSDPRLPQLDEVHCPKCSRPNAAGIVMRVPRGVCGVPVPYASLRPGDVVHACAGCPKCQQVYCFITERRWRDKALAA